MRYAIILLSLAGFTAEAKAQATPPPARPICVLANRDNDYNARPIGQHDILVQNAVGDRRGVRVSTTCIHIYPDSFVAVHSAFSCVGMGDDVSVRTIDGHGERCRAVHVTPFVEGSIAAPYK